MIIKKSDIKYFKHARQVALNSDFGREKIGCVVVYKKGIYSTGYNTFKTHTVQMKYNKLRFSEEGAIHKTHAEISALLRIQYSDIDWSKVSIYVYRICPGKIRGFGMSRPCKSCMAFIRKLGIKNIYYTTDYGFAYEKLLY